MQSPSASANVASGRVVRPTHGTACSNRTPISFLNNTTQHHRRRHRSLVVGRWSCVARLPSFVVRPLFPVPCSLVGRWSAYGIVEAIAKKGSASMHAAPRVLVLRAAGINCDEETAAAVELA